MNSNNYEEYLKQLEDSPREYQVLAKLVIDILSVHMLKVKKLEYRIEALDNKITEMLPFLEKMAANYNPIFQLESKEED